MAAAKPKFEIVSRGTEFFVRLRAKNGEILNSTKMFTSLQAAKDNTKATKKAASTAKTIEVAE
jgi:uncharacterized protein YegP (UPF0339 family)